MAGDVTKVKVGRALIYSGITNPATGTPPTWMTHTAGVPASGTDIGFTENDTVFEYIAEKTPISAEQNTANVGVYVSGEMCKLTFTMKEHNYNALKLAFDNIGNLDDGTRTGFYGGGGTSILSPTLQALFFSAPDRLAPTKFIIGVIYKGYSVKGYSSPFSKKNQSLIAVEINAIADTSRNAGDQVFQFQIEK